MRLTFWRKRQPQERWARKEPPEKPAPVRLFRCDCGATMRMVWLESRVAPLARNRCLSCGRQWYISDYRKGYVRQWVKEGQKPPIGGSNVMPPAPPPPPPPWTNPSRR